MIALGKTTTPSEQRSNLEAVWSRATKQRMGVTIGNAKYGSRNIISVKMLRHIQAAEGERTEVLDCWLCGGAPTAEDGADWECAMCGGTGKEVVTRNEAGEAMSYRPATESDIAGGIHGRNI